MGQLFVQHCLFDKTMKEKLKLGLVELDTCWENPMANMAAIDDLMTSVEDCDMLLLPEAFNTGFTKNCKQVAEDAEGGITLPWMRNVAVRYDMAVCGTIFVSELDRYVNRFYFVKPSGEVEFYDKRHLFGLSFESQLLDEGQERKVVEYLGWKFMLQTCYDLRFPEWGRNEFKDGSYLYDVVINLANWPASRDKQRRVLMEARAIENQAYFVGVNRRGKDGNGWVYDGGSRVIDPNGEDLGYRTCLESIVLFGDLEAAKLTDYRQKFPVAKDW